MLRTLGSFALGWDARQPVASLPPITPVGFVSFAAGLGYQGVQFSDNLPLHHLSDSDFVELRAHADALDMVIEVGTRRLEAAVVNRYLEIAIMLGSPFVRLVVDDTGFQPSCSEIISRLRSCIQEFDRVGVVLALENHDRLRAAELNKVLEAVDSRSLGICFDTANSFGAGEDPLTVVSLLAPHVVNIHMKDVAIERFPHKQGFTIKGTPLGKGQMPLTQVLSTAGLNGRLRSATVEHWIEPEETPAETFVKAKEWCRQSAPALKDLCAHFQYPA